MSVERGSVGQDNSWQSEPGEEKADILGIKGETNLYKGVGLVVLGALAIDEPELVGGGLIVYGAVKLAPGLRNLFRGTTATRSD